MDLAAIDNAHGEKLARHAVTGDSCDRPNRTVTGLVERKEPGRRTWRGCYVYDADGTRRFRGDLVGRW